MAIKNMVGEIYGRLKVIEFSHLDKIKHYVTKSVAFKIVDFFTKE